MLIRDYRGQPVECTGITVKISATSAAFDANPYRELADILRYLTDKVDNGDLQVALFDDNGNCVGDCQPVTE